MGIHYFIQWGVVGPNSSICLEMLIVSVHRDRAGAAWSSLMPMMAYKHDEYRRDAKSKLAFLGIMKFLLNVLVRRIFIFDFFASAD